MPALPTTMSGTDDQARTIDPEELQRLRDFEATHRVITPAVPTTVSWSSGGVSGSFPVTTGIPAPEAEPTRDVTPPPRSHFPLLEAGASLAREAATSVTDVVDAAERLRSLLDRHLDTTRASRVSIEEGMVELVDKLGLDREHLRRLLTPPAPLS
jgi:hypothetical protein